MKIWVLGFGKVREKAAFKLGNLAGKEKRRRSAIKERSKNKLQKPMLISSPSKRKLYIKIILIKILLFVAVFSFHFISSSSTQL